MGSLQFGLENQIGTGIDNYIFYYNTYDREYDERELSIHMKAKF